MITWQFDLLFLQQIIENPNTFSDVESKVKLVLPIFRSWLPARAYEWFGFWGPTPLDYAHIGFLVIRWLDSIFDHVDGTLVSRLITTPSGTPRFFGSAFTIQSPL
jgi:hypothetical protein